MTTNNNTANAAVSFPVFGLAFAVLLVLKIAGLAGASWGLANLSWWWVFSPLLIGFGIFFLVLAFVLLVALIAALSGR
jgi:hypothetical protein